MTDRVPPGQELSALTVRDVVAVIEALYPASLAAEWDSIGLICGYPSAPVRSILLAVDASEEVGDEALRLGASLLVTHHPLFLSGVTSVAADTSKGRLIHRLIRGDVALFNAHTNADSASPGVSDALAAALGIVDLAPLQAVPGGSAAEGLGRVGRLLEPVTLGDFVERVALALPTTARGAAVSGDLGSIVTRAAVCGGSGDFLLAAANASGADVFVTADLRHHRVAEHRDDGGCALVDVAHWASEWPWLESAAALLGAELARLPGGDDIEIVVSRLCTDPWASQRHSAE